jgi:hypothetical protein
MQRISENIIEGSWNLGEFLTTDLLASPIRRMINRDAMRAGIDLGNPRRSVASLFGSCGMGAALGSILGPPGGILGGLLGYIVALGSDYEGDRIENFHDAEVTTLYIFELKAFQIAAEATQDLVTEEIWAEICDEIDYEIEGLTELPDPPESLDDTLALMFEVVGESIRRVDFEAYLEFFTAYEDARLELGL